MWKACELREHRRLNRVHSDPALEKVDRRGVDVAACQINSAVERKVSGHTSIATGEFQYLGLPMHLVTMSEPQFGKLSGRICSLVEIVAHSRLVRIKLRMLHDESENIVGGMNCGRDRET